MCIDMKMFFLFMAIIPIVSSRSGFSEQYLNKNYTSLIVETRPMSSIQVSSKFNCLRACLSEDDCSLAVFNIINYQCSIYNIFPIVEDELLPDNNTIVFLFNHTVQLSPLVSDTNWLISRLNTTHLVTTIPVPYSRYVVQDIFGYLLTFETSSATTYINRYDRTSLTLIKRIPLPMQYTTAPALTYYNRMIFIGTPNNNVLVFDDVKFTLLVNITCGSNLAEPRNIIFMESQKLMIIVSYANNKLVFFRINSPTNYTCLNSTTLNGGPQALLKINDNLFHVSTYDLFGIYSYQFNGQVWISSLFANVSQSLGLSNIGVAQLRMDNLQRRWVAIPKFGLIVYDELGTCLGKWKVGVNPFDVFITNDYRLAIAEYKNATLSLYDPQIRT